MNVLHFFTLASLGYFKALCFTAFFFIIIISGSCSATHLLTAFDTMVEQILRRQKSA